MKRTKFDVRDLLLWGPLVHGLSGGFLRKKYHRHRIAILVGAGFALFSSVASIVTLYSWSGGLLSYLWWSPTEETAPKRKKNSSHQDACNLDGKTIQYSYMRCSQENNCTTRTRQKMVIVGDRLSHYQNPETAETVDYQIGKTIELPPQKTSVPIGYFKSFGTASYIDGKLRVVREDIRYVNTELVGQTALHRWEISVSQCKSCTLTESIFALRTMNRPDINDTFTDGWCMIGPN